MVESLHTRINLPDRTYQAAARSEIKKIAEAVGFEGHRLGEMEIIIAEITSNLWKHSPSGGYLLVRVLSGGEPGIELIAIDNGPGMRLPASMMKDGNSTTKTLGQGLGAIRRLASVFDLYSLAGWGTILLSRTYVKKAHNENLVPFQMAAISVCKKGQVVSGDAYKFIANSKKVRGIMIDGLGHGPSANEAATEAVRSFVSLPNTVPTEQILSLHQQLKRTRGAVVNVVFIDLVNQQISYSGVGNISMKVISQASVKGCFSYNGIVGHIMPGVLNNHNLPWQNNDIIILHTDGLISRWDVSRYPAILQHNPIMLCAALYKDYDRGTDDTTVMVGRFVKKTAMNADVEILKLDIHNEMDVMLAHRRAMQFAKFSGISLAEQTRFATAVSEICRNTMEYARKGAIVFTIRKNTNEFNLEALIRDEGPGISELQQILIRNPETHRGRGLGIVYARRLADFFEITSNGKGTTVVLKMDIPLKTDMFSKLVISGWLKHLANEPAISAYEELKIRNSQLLEMTEELTKNGRMVEKQMLEIKQLNLQLSENNERMKEFTYAISHDLKNPLSSLKIAAEQLGRRPVGDEATVFHGVLTRSVNRLDKTIHSLIEILDIQNQTKDVSRELEFTRLLAEAADEFAHVVADTGTVIESDFISAPRISYIEGYLQSLFHNLISNSLKYRNPEHPPFISVKTSSIKSGVRLQFQDNGIGMDLSKVKDRLFQPFSRFSTSHDGKGIGLYLIKGMVESNGGRVGVDSTPGEGTTFVFDLVSYA